MFRTSRVLAALAVLTIALTGCTSKKDAAPAADLPDAVQLLTDGGKAMTAVKTAHFVINVKGKVSGLALQQAEGDLTQEGSAKGSAKVEQLGAVMEAKFIIVGTSLYLQGPTGGYQKLPLAMAASVYDPSAILDPNRGVAKLLNTAKKAKTEARESVDGHDAYRLSVEPDPADLAGLIPGAAAGVKGLIWLDATTKQLLKGEFTMPPAGSDPAGTVTVTFTNYNAPVTVSAP
jgi:lipoprotein LprG